MRNAQPQPKKRLDYAPSAYLIDSVDLCFQLHEGYTDVSSVLNIRPNPLVEGPADLVLDGEHMELLEIGIDGQLLVVGDYEIDDEHLSLPARNKPFQLRTLVRLKPEENTRLEGLYKTNGLYCTQCEAEGFRSITYYLDRPDVMATFSTTIIADAEKYPVMLSNGNAAKRWDVGKGRHAVTWKDPFRKPAYLFALVAGSLEKQADTFTTMTGRTIDLEIWVEPRNIDKCEHAMKSLKKSMKWDEEAYGREYDLDIFMIVAVDDFNMGAMENKGLNVFNAKFILARPDTATDQDYAGIESVVAHEYFHNWTGNRITCRDWFQLTLKEGLTVFRDQRFSADMNSAAMQRLQDVKMLRSHQFPEDAGPTAHPIRPEQYIEMNNFYTATVYEKGAEVIRMLDTLLGRDGFRLGMDLYFERHDGQAVTCDDFVAAMADANGRDLTQFGRWYTHLGTPTVVVEQQQNGNQLTVSFTQSQPVVAGQQDDPQPLHIPLALGVMDANGQDLPVQLTGEEPGNAGTRVLELTESAHTFELVNVPVGSKLSVLRNFSAPVKVQQQLTADDNAFLLAHDSDDFNRWEAGQRLALGVLQSLSAAHANRMPPAADDPNTQKLMAALAAVAADDSIDPALKAELLTLPTEEYLGQQQEVVAVDSNHAARNFLREQLAVAFADDWLRMYNGHQNSPDGLSGAAARRLRHVAMSYLATAAHPEAEEFVKTESASQNMTDVIAALATALEHFPSLSEQLLADFYDRWKADPQVLDKWFSLQANATSGDTIAKVRKLLEHKDFTLKTPNRARSLIAVFAMANLAQFHRADGEGYLLLGDQIELIDPMNPQLAARLVVPLLRWRRFDESRQGMMKAQLQRLQQNEGVSKDLGEQLGKSLADT